MFCLVKFEFGAVGLCYRILPGQDIKLLEFKTWYKEDSVRGLTLLELNFICRKYRGCLLPSYYLVEAQLGRAFLLFSHGPYSTQEDTFTYHQGEQCR